MQEYWGMYSYRKQLYVRYCVGSAFCNPQIFTLLLFLLIYPPRVWINYVIYVFLSINYFVRRQYITCWSKRIIIISSNFIKESFALNLINYSAWMYPIWIHMDLQLMVTAIKVCKNRSLFLISGSSFNPRMNWKLIYKYHVKLVQAIDYLYPDHFLPKV